MKIDNVNVICSMGVSSMEVRRVSELRAGDHIKWKRLEGYDHHAIVEWVDHYYGEVHVIEYQKKGQYDRRVRVIRSVIRDVATMYKYIYDKCYNAGTVLQRARSRLNETAYNLLTSNCEHFATWCKTGYERCSQMPSAIRRGSMYAVEGLAAGGRCVAKCAVAAAESGTTIARELIRTSLPNAVANGGKAFVQNALTVAGKAFGPLTALCEVPLFAYNCYNAHKKYKAAVRRVEDDSMKPRLKQQRNRNIREGGFEGLGAVGGAVIGAAVGSVIPALGTLVGGLIGGFGGRILGKLFGRWLHR